MLTGIVAGVFALLAGAGGPGPSAVSASHAPEDPTLEAIARIVRASFYSPEVLEQVGWDGLVERARQRLASAPAARERILGELVAGLGASHTEYIPRSDPRYLELASILAPLFAEVPDHCPERRTLPPLPAAREEIGVLWQREAGRWFIAGLFDDGPAQRAGLLAGDEVLSANGARFDPVTAFAERSGQRVALEYRRQRDGPGAVAQVVPRTIEPQVAFREALRSSARILERDGRRVAYVRVWSWAGQEMQQELRAAIALLNERNPTGFVLDLRGGWGGASPYDIDVFDRRVPVLESRARDGAAYRYDPQIRVSAALLIDGGTRSGKETVAYAVKKHHLAVLVGERTAGAMLPGSPWCLPDGALLYLAVADFRVDGERLEGRGVAPDVAVVRELPWSAGRDVQLEEAVRQVLATVSPAPAAPPPVTAPRTGPDTAPPPASPRTSRSR